MTEGGRDVRPSSEVGCVMDARIVRLGELLLKRDRRESLTKMESAELEQLAAQLPAIWPEPGLHERARVVEEQAKLAAAISEAAWARFGEQVLSVVKDAAIQAANIGVGAALAELRKGFK